MSVTVAAIMRQIRNHFVSGYLDATFAVEGGHISPAPAAPFVYIKGSAALDGVWECKGGQLVGADADETFTGRVWLLQPPRDFVQLCEEIAAYDEKNPTGAPQTENFGEYSYTRPNVYTGGGPWLTVFKAQLAPYRRMVEEAFDDGAD